MRAAAVVVIERVDRVVQGDDQLGSVMVILDTDHSKLCRRARDFLAGEKGTDKGRDQGTLALLEHFDAVEEIVQTLLMSDAEADDRIELLRCHKGTRARYRPRIYRQETVTIPIVSGERYDPKPREMLVWRDYEMGFQSTDDLNLALKMAVKVIEQKRGR